MSALLPLEIDATVHTMLRFNKTQRKFCVCHVTLELNVDIRHCCCYLNGLIRQSSVYFRVRSCSGSNHLHVVKATPVGRNSC